MKISELIREERLKKNLTMVQLAELMDCTQSVISAWELGRSEPGPKYMRKLKDVLGISLYTTTENENTRYVAEDPPKYDTPTKDDNINKLITSNQMLAESQKILAESNLKLAESNLKLASLVDTINVLTQSNKKYYEESLLNKK